MIVCVDVVSAGHGDWKKMTAWGPWSPMQVHAEVLLLRGDEDMPKAIEYLTAPLLRNAELRSRVIREMRVWP